MADDFVVLGIRRHPVPESRRKAGRGFSDDGMEPLGHGAIRFPHLGDLRQHGALPLPLASLHLLDAVPYRASFLLGECLADRKSTRLNSSHSQISYAVFCLKK